MQNPQRAIRRIEGRKLADFDDRLWPTVLLWASLGLGIGAMIVRGGDFHSTELVDNAWVHLGLLAAIVLLLGVAIFALEGRLQRRTLLAVMISLVVHTWLSMASYHVSLGRASRPQDAEPSLEDEAPSHLPDYQWQREETMPVTEDPLAQPVPTALPDMPELPGAAIERGDTAAVQLEKEAPLDSPPEPQLPSLDEIERAEMTAPRRSESLAGPEITRQELKDELAPVPVEAPTVSENVTRGDTFDAQVTQPDRQQPTTAAGRQALPPGETAAMSPSDAKVARRESREVAGPSAPLPELERSAIAARAEPPAAVEVPGAVREAAGRPKSLEPAGALPARQLGSGNASLPARNTLPSASSAGPGAGSAGVADIERNLPATVGPASGSVGAGAETARVGRSLSAPEIVGDGPAVPRESAPAGGGTAARSLDPSSTSAGAMRRGDTSGVGELRRPGTVGAPGASGENSPGGAPGLVIGSGDGLRRAELSDRNALGSGAGAPGGAGIGSSGAIGSATGRQMASGIVGNSDQIEVPIGSAGPQPGGAQPGGTQSGGGKTAAGGSQLSGTSGSGGTGSGATSIAGSTAAAPNRRMTRVDGTIPVRVPAPAGPGGLGGDVRPELGLPSRQARPESDVAHSVASRLILEKSGGSAAVDGRVRDTAVPGLQQRDSRDRERLATRRGGSQGTERAVELGLDFLARHQSPDGSWSLNNFGGGRAGYDRAGQASMQSDTAGTGLALLAFLGAGYTHTDGKYRQAVARGLDYLISHQKPDGDLFVGGSQYCWLYSHGIASIALCEAYGMTRDTAVRGPAQQALRFIAAAQNPTEGGWRYSPGRDSDTSVSGWQLMALKSGDLAGLEVPPDCYARIAHWLDGAEAGNNSRYVYRPKAEQAHQREPSKAMTAEALLMRQYLGWKRDHPDLVAGANYLRENLPELGSRAQPQRDAYYWYYATQVMFQMQGAHWQDWNSRLSELLTSSQVQSGPLAGSWDPVGPTIADRWGAAGGRLYVTSMQLLMLEVYYRHLPLYQNLE